jgi:hypothetical protein
MDNIKIKNFNLAAFSRLLNQSLLVTNQIMMEVKDGLVKSCSFSATKSFIKLWTIPVEQLIIVDEAQKEMFDMDKAKAEFRELNFNFYILKGDLFRRFISVHNQDTVDIEFSIVLVDGKKQASTITITGKSEAGSALKTTFILTTEELITNVVSDYSAILAACSPDKDMMEIVFLDEQIQEIKGLIKKLHKSSSENSKYLTFTIDNKAIRINDRVFTVEFPVNKEMVEKNNLAGRGLVGDASISFNVLKSDFIITGDHTFNFFTSDQTDKVIIIGKYSKAMIVCLTTKITEGSDAMDSSADDSLGELDLSEYGLIGDELSI